MYILGTPKLDIVLQVESHRSGIERENRLPCLLTILLMQSRMGLAFWIAYTLLACIQFFIHWYPQVLCKAAFNLCIAQLLFVVEISSTHVQNLALGLVVFHEFCTSQPLQPVKVSLNGIPSLQRSDCTT